MLHPGQRFLHSYAIMFSIIFCKYPVFVNPEPVICRKKARTNQ